MLAGRERARDRSLGVRSTVAFLGALTVGWVLRSPMALVAGPAVALGLLRAYDLRLARSAGRRQRAIERQVPEMVELLVATSDAGLAPRQAFARARSMLGAPLGTELDRVVRAVELGEPWRNALEDLVRRSDVPSLRRVTAALARSGRLGTSLDVTLRTLAEDLRDERRAHAEDAARRAPVKMLFPLVFLILPAFLLLTVGPVLLATLRSLH
jgi:tight adherence protein C